MNYRYEILHPLSGRYARFFKGVVLPTIVGIIAGLGAISFFWMLDASRFFFLEYLGGYTPVPPGGESSLFPESATALNRWMLLILPVIGGLISGIIVFAIAPEAEGHGTDAGIDAYHNKGGNVRSRVPLVKAISSALTIGSGGSGGREGPIAQIGAGFGSMLGRWLGLSSKERRILLVAGMGAGIGSIFHAPMAGALFAAEVLYKDMELEGEILVPTTIASIIAYAVFAIRFGWDPLFVTPDLHFSNVFELLPYTFLALVLAGGAWLYAKSFFTIRKLFHLIPGPPHFKPALGGLFVGLVAFFGVPEAMASGYGLVQEALNGQVGVQFLLLVAFLKILTTGFTIGSGGSGGMFGPAVVIGGAFGGAVGFGIQHMAPALVDHPESFVIVGMAGFFAAAANTPISTVIMVSEMTGSYHLLVPTLWVCILAYLLLRKTTIYDTQAENRFDSPAHLQEMVAGTLQRFHVWEALPKRERTLVQIDPNANLDKIHHFFAEVPQEAFPVFSDDGELLGIINNEALRVTLGHPELRPLILARDLAIAVPLVTPSDDLLTATQKMGDSGVDEILVVDPKDAHKVLGILQRRQILATYAKRVKEEALRVVK